MTDETTPQAKPDGEKSGAPVATKKSRFHKPRPLSITPGSIPVPTKEDRRFFWCGVLPECPVQTIHAGGIDFPRFVQKQIPNPEKGEHAHELGKEQHAGRIHELSDRQVDLCLDAVARKIIRARKVMSVDGSRGRPFTPMQDDKPLASFVYMMEVPDPKSVNRDMDAVVKNTQPLLVR